MKRVAVRYMSFPSVEKGLSGFYAFRHDGQCAKPRTPYEIGAANGWCHTEKDELDKLAEKVGFKSREMYRQERKKQGIKSWKKAYGIELAAFAGEKLETGGIVWHVQGEEVEFYCPKGEFVSRG